MQIKAKQVDGQTIVQVIDSSMEADAGGVCREIAIDGGGEITLALPSVTSEQGIEVSDVTYPSEPDGDAAEPDPVGGTGQTGPQDGGAGTAEPPADGDEAESTEPPINAAEQGQDTPDETPSY